MKLGTILGAEQCDELGTLTPSEQYEQSMMVAAQEAIDVKHFCKALGILRLHKSRFPESRIMETRDNWIVYLEQVEEARVEAKKRRGQEVLNQVECLKSRKLETETPAQIAEKRKALSLAFGLMAQGKLDAAERVVGGFLEREGAYVQAIKAKKTGDQVEFSKAMRGVEPL